MTTQTQNKIVNDVNITQLGETIHNVRQDPQLAAFKARAKNKWISGTFNKITIDDYYLAKEEQKHKQSFQINADEPPILLGQDRGANPVEILLGALSGCMTTTLAVYSAVQDLKVESIQSEYEGDLDLQGFLGIREDVNTGYNEIRVKFKVKGDATEEQIREMVKKSPVYDTLIRPIKIKINVEKE